MNNQNHVLTSVSAEGSVECDFDTVIFTGSASGDGPTSTKAKEKLETIVRELVAVFSKFQDEIDQPTLVKKTDTRAYMEYTTPKGTKKKVAKRYYRASYNFGFRAKSMEQVSEIQEALELVEDASISEPSYEVKNRDAVQSKALASAMLKVSNRFADQCRILGLQSSNYEILAFDARYDDHRRSRPVIRAMSASVAGGGQMLESATFEQSAGQAEISVSLSVSYGTKTKS